VKNQQSLPQQIEDILEQGLKTTDPDARILVKRTSLGWVHLHIVSTMFQGKSETEREQAINALLTDIPTRLTNYPFANYDLVTPEEAKETKFSFATESVQLPLWSELLMAPEPDQRASLDAEKDTEKRPFVVTFYSFKGGVGRTTALGLIARMLATDSYRVVMIDFDLEAPGLSFLFPSAISTNQTAYGVLDYLHQRYLTPDQDIPPISECIQQIELPSRGELYLIPSGEYEEGYVHRLADLDVRLFYSRENNPIDQMIKDITTHLHPDIILIDARTGFTAIGAVALLDLADLGVICFSPTEQSFAGLRWVIQAAQKQNFYRGTPDLRFLLSPIPQVDAIHKQEWVVKAEEWISNVWEIPPDLSVAELHTDIPYNTAITTLGNLLEEPPAGIQDAYLPMAETISSVLPPAIAANTTSRITDEFRKKVLQELIFRSATAQEMDADKIPKIFQKTGDFPKVLQDNTWLVRGAKGTGKSLLFRLFVERPEDAIRMAKSETNLQNVQFIPGHGRTAVRPTLLDSNDMESYQKQVDADRWSLFWRFYALLQICAAEPELRQLQKDQELVALSEATTPAHTDIVTWMIKQSEQPLAASHIGDALRQADQLLTRQEKKVWLIYDELDTGFRSEDVRHHALEALFAWWIESAPSFKHIVPKILLREDLWQNLNFTNKGHFTGRAVLLRWDEPDLWRLVLRQALQSPTLADLVKRQYIVTPDSLDKIELERLRESLFPLWGERMGRGKKAYTYNWIRNRITDGNNSRFPRSMIVLLQKAVAFEKEHQQRNPYDSILRPQALIASLSAASEQRVAEVRNEYPELTLHLDKLSGERSPIEESRLEEIWKKQGPELKNLIERMKQAGILQDYLRGSPTDISRYGVAELYLNGLSMIRKGQQ
jgi:MinD-like ATPase involved in chromosome partitioning or flagellar assembly/stress-induced morphogen